MRSLTKTFLLAWLGIWGVTGADNFAAVPGTGWTDITQLQSTCSQPGYFTNPSDCSRFYVCVDHSTAERSLLLRYDFDCPGGLAFDESTKNCNYPGPSGCVSPGSGWGWTKPAQGIWQSTATVSRPPSWGTPTRHPVGTTVIRVQNQASSGPTIIHRPSTSHSVPSNPRVTIPTNTVLQVPPVTTWESQRLVPRPVNPGVFESARVTASSSSETGGWQANRVINTGVFESAKVTHQQAPTPSNPTVAWGAAQIIPVNTGAYESVRVTAAPPVVQWETPRPFPSAPQGGRPVKIVEHPSNGWSAIRISPTPTPVPSNPSLQLQNYVVATQAPTTWQAARVTSVASEQALPVQNLSPELPQQVAPVTWQSSRLTQGHQTQPAVSWQSQRITQVSQNPSVSWQSSRVTQPQQPPRLTWNGPQADNPSVTIVQSNAVPVNPNYTQANQNAANPSYQTIRQSYSQQAANPSLNLPAGLENVRITQIPSGYIWQSVTNIKPSQPDTYVSSTPASIESPIQGPTSGSSEVSSGDFGIVQQVINEQQGQNGGGGKSHIQLVYETKENQNQEQLQQVQVVQSQQNPATLQQVSSSEQGGNSIYEFIAPPGSGIKGRIIVLYAPGNNHGGKREAPLIEVEVEDRDDDSDSSGSSDDKSNDSGAANSENAQ